VAIDIHNHLHFPFGEPYTIEPERLLNSGVLRRVCLLSVGNCWTTCTRDEDEELLRLAKTYDGFFVPFAHLDFTRSPDTVDDFHRRGFAGRKAIFPPLAYDDARCFPFYDRAGRHRMPILFHLGGSGYFSPDEVTLPPQRFASKHMLVITVDLVAKLFPKLPIICGHFGGGREDYERAVYTAKGHPNVYLETSCSAVERAAASRSSDLGVITTSGLRLARRAWRRSRWKYWAGVVTLAARMLPSAASVRKRSSRALECSGPAPS